MTGDMLDRLPNKKVRRRGAIAPSQKMPPVLAPSAPLDWGCGQTRSRSLLRAKRLRDAAHIRLLHIRLRRGQWRRAEAWPGVPLVDPDLSALKTRHVDSEPNLLFELAIKTTIGQAAAKSVWRNGTGPAPRSSPALWFVASSTEHRTERSRRIAPGPATARLCRTPMPEPHTAACAHRVGSYQLDVWP